LYKNKCLMDHHFYTEYIFPKNKLFSVMSNCSTNCDLHKVVARNIRKNDHERASKTFGDQKCVTRTPNIVSAMKKRTTESYREQL
jgi:hypothetical protein